MRVPLIDATFSDKGVPVYDILLCIGRNVHIAPPWMSNALSELKLALTKSWSRVLFDREFDFGVERASRISDEF